MMVILAKFGFLQVENRPAAIFTLVQDADGDLSDAVCGAAGDMVAELRRPHDEILLFRGLAEDSLRKIAAQVSKYGYDVASRAGKEYNQYEVIAAARLGFFKVGQTFVAEQSIRL